MVGAKGQTGAIKQYLESGKTLTNAEAAKLFGCYRLSARIKDLRDAGMNISTIMIDGETRYGTSTRYARYKLIK